MRDSSVEDGVDLSRLGESHHLLALDAVVLGAGCGLLEHGDDVVASAPCGTWCRTGRSITLSSRRLFGEENGRFGDPTVHVEVCFSTG